ncbi:carboxymuconolactone decarboxylase family protein [Acuticoccus kandeliae]|uniref:carboxymuconolactone decarboxylase family protein n=1 Tax=Acuticoccus kandeliae TaxID=2073160 RepID=UPI000D3E4251|nr:carboxymuconolactone decarboxylase family protein [Acuticoccus kandeliae]
MQRIPSIDHASATGRAKELLDGVKAGLGVVPNLFRLTAQSPTGLAGLLGFHAALAGGEVDGATQERIALAVANVNGCDYCNAAHTLLAKRQKLDEAEIAANREGHSADAKADAAVAFARKVAVSRAAVSEADIAAVRQAGWSDGALVEIVLLVAYNTATNYLNEAFQTEIDFPLPAVPAARAA